MSDWYWVRHGPTHQKVMIGWTDVTADLSDSARIARLERFLPGDARVVSSDLVRARATADAIRAERRRDPDVPDLREMHFGDWENRGFAEVERDDGDRLRAFWDEPGQISAPRGESWDGFAARVNAWVDPRAGDGPVIVVAHLGVILSQVQRALGLSARETFARKIDNLSVTHLHFDGSWHLDRINHCP